MSGQMLRVSASPDQDQATLCILTHSLRREQLMDFQAACTQLLETRRRELIIDAKEVHIMGSVFIGVVITTALKAKEEGGYLTLLATKSLADILHRLLADTVDIRVVPDR